MTVATAVVYDVSIVTTKRPINCCLLETTCLHNNWLLRRRNFAKDTEISSFTPHLKLLSTTHYKAWFQDAATRHACDLAKPLPFCGSATNSFQQVLGCSAFVDQWRVLMSAHIHYNICQRKAKRRLSKTHLKTESCWQRFDSASIVNSTAGCSLSAQQHKNYTAVILIDRTQFLRNSQNLSGDTLHCNALHYDAC